MSEQRQKKALPQFVKAINGRQVTGVFSVFGNVDSGNDRIWPGSFSKTLQERADRVLFLWQHDLYQPPTAKILSLREIGRNELPQAVLDAAPDATGGCEVVREYLDTPRGNESFEAIKNGVPLQMSFMYQVIKWDMEKPEDAKSEWDLIRNIREVKLWEVSDVNFGANDATVASKSLDQLAHEVEQFLREMKAGARHTKHEIEMLNKAHRLIVELGCTECSGIQDQDQADDAKSQSRADTDLGSLTQQRKQRLRAAAAALALAKR